MVKSMDNRNIGDTFTQLSLFDTLNVHGVSCLSSFDYMYSTLNLQKAWYMFSRGKHSRLDVMSYERELEQNIFKLQEELASGEYRHGRYQPFTVWDPKQRRIHKATVEDRIIHQLIVNTIEPFFEPRFIFDSYSCRKGKGTHAAIQRLRSFLRTASSNNTDTIYALKCDIKQFFASVDHTKLMELIKARVSDDQAIELIRIVIDSYSETPGKGIPLGNLTSQLFANIYMHEFDWFVKQTMREKHYLRYCDDFIILSTDRDHLLSLIQPISAFLEGTLQLSLHPNKLELRSWNQGIDFLGYVLKPHSTVLRSKTKNRALRSVNEDNISSYLGLCVHADAYELSNLMRTIVWQNTIGS